MIAISCSVFPNKLRKESWQKSIQLAKCIGSICFTNLQVVNAKYVVVNEKTYFVYLEVDIVRDRDSD